MTKKRNILIMTELNRQSQRERLSGICQFANARTSWELQVISGLGRQFIPLVQAAADRGLDGVLLNGIPPPEALEAFVSRQIPVVFMDASPCRLPANCPSHSVAIDDAAIGRAAADIYLHKGRFASYCYAPQSFNVEFDWSLRRGKAFIARLRSARKTCRRLNGNLADELKALPKPAALFAAFDYEAELVLSACKAAGIAVPDEISILGVDNDLATCERVRPRLSSLRIDHTEQGFKAARSLAQLLAPNRRSLHCMTVCRIPAVFVERESTPNQSPALSLVERAETIIRDPSSSTRRVDKLAAELGVSANLLNLRFRETRGRSPRSTLNAAKLAQARERLANTADSVFDVALAIGFSSTAAFIHFFKSQTGLTPGEYRRQHIRK